MEVVEPSKKERSLLAEKVLFEACDMVVIALLVRGVPSFLAVRCTSSFFGKAGPASVGVFNFLAHSSTIKNVQQVERNGEVYIDDERGSAKTLGVATLLCDRESAELAHLPTPGGPRRRGLRLKLGQWARQSGQASQ